MKIKNTFVGAKMNTEVDERLLPKGEYPKAYNIKSSSTDGSDLGAIENVLGNKRLSFIDLDGAKCIGALADGSNRKIYWFVTSTEKDAILEYDEDTEEVSFVLQSSVPGVLNFNKDYLITGVNKIINGKEDKDLLAWTDNYNPPRIINIEEAKQYALDGFTEEDISVIKNPPEVAPEVNLTFTPSGLEDDIRDKFLTFFTRYKYKNGFYSALSSPTTYQFDPKGFEIDYETMENNGMENFFNAVEINFNTGGDKVIGVDVVYKESRSNNLYLIESFDKEEQNWDDNEVRSIVFGNNKTYQVLPEDEILRTFDNVPRLAKAQELVGNRLSYGNVLEGYNMVDSEGEPIKVDFDLELESEELTLEELPITIDDFSLFVNLAGVDLVSGKQLVFELRLTEILDGEPDTGTYFDTLYFNLNRDYSGVDDLATSEEFIFFVENIMSNSFFNKYNATPPDTSVVDTQEGFYINSYTSNLIEIVSPKITYTVSEEPVISDWVYDESITKVYVRGVNSFRSIKSNRSYEVGLVYMDKESRKSTVQVCPSNTIFVDSSLSGSVNKLLVNIHHKAPYWADRYKIAVKQNKIDYENVYCNIFYEDGLFRWVKLEGANRDKVREGDTLIVKSDLGGIVLRPIKVRVLEVTTKERNFLSGELDEGELGEEPGLYMKIKPVGFDMSFTGETNKSFSGNSHLRYPQKTFTEPTFPQLGDPNFEDVVLKAGSSVRIFIEFQAWGSISYLATYDKSFRVNDDYDSVEDWFNAEVGDLGSFGEEYTRGNGSNNNRGTGWDFEDNAFWVRAHRDGTASRKIATTVRFDIRFSEGTVIFETESKQSDLNVYYETSETFYIQDGDHQGNLQNQTTSLPAKIKSDFFNCFVFGNGVESYKYKDVFNGKPLDIDLRPTSTSLEKYSEVRRYADISYSSPYNENTNLNGLNKFNLGLANFKEDIDKKYGAIQKLHSRDTDLLVFQEDKVSKVMYGKSVLMNADGTSNVSSIEDVLGQQVPYSGEYGISDNPEGFSFFGNMIYFPDRKRGAILRLAENGIVEISESGMKTWFKNKFNTNTKGVILGCYDPYYNEYIVSFGNKGDCDYEMTKEDTLTFDERVKGWTSFHSFRPEFMIGVNNKLYTFKGGDLFKHHETGSFVNQYYGESFKSFISLMMNDEPSTIKALKSVMIEGSTPWETKITAFVSNDDDVMYSTIGKEEYKKKEGLWYAYTRRNEDIDNLNSKATYGIGRAQQITPTTISFTGGSNFLTVGDLIHTVSEVQPIGVVQQISGNIITLAQSSPYSLSPGSFIYGQKDPRIEGSILRGYNFKVDLLLNSNKKEELYAVNGDIFKSS